MFAFVENNPVNHIDVLGLQSGDSFTERGCTKLPWDPYDKDALKKQLEEKLKEECKQHPIQCLALGLTLGGIALTGGWPEEGKKFDYTFSDGDWSITVGGKTGGSGWDAITTPPSEWNVDVGWKF